MGQEDYLIREIEKIALMLQVILGKLTGNKKNVSVSPEKQFEETKEMLFSDINFDVEKFLKLDEVQSNKYILSLKGNSTDNLEILAEIISQLGLIGNPEYKYVCLRKSLQLYEYCNSADKTYSVERESRIREIREKL